MRGGWFPFVALCAMLFVAGIWLTVLFLLTGV